MKTTVTLLLLVLLSSVDAIGQSVLGKWKTIDDNTNKARSIVEIYEMDGKVFGKVEKLFREPDEDPDPICEECDDSDDRKNQKVIGMEILRDMEKEGDEYEDGTILDPENGKVYDCKIWVDPDHPNKLNVRGYVAFFFRTQVWVRYE
jgi:uncharacterized protein (DUF2147 family)